MPTSPDYALVDQLALRIGILELSTGAQDAIVADLQQALTAASRRIDKDTGRRFWLDSSVNDRVYDITHRRKVVTDDIGDLTGLVVKYGSDSTGWTTVPSTTYRLKPGNALVDNEPYYILERTGCYQWCVGLEVKVTAKFGWPEIPEPIREATLLLAARLHHRKDSELGYIMNEAGDGLARIGRLDPDYQALIAPYKRPEF